MNISEKYPVIACGRNLIDGLKTENKTIASDETNFSLHTELILKEEFLSDEEKVEVDFTSVIKKSEARLVSSLGSNLDQQNENPFVMSETIVKEEYEETTPGTIAYLHRDSEPQVHQYLRTVKSENGTNQYQEDGNARVCLDDLLACSSNTGINTRQSHESLAKLPTESKISCNSNHVKLVDVCVVLEDLFSKKERQLGKMHINTSACSCIYCRRDFKSNSTLPCSPLKKNNGPSLRNGHDSQEASCALNPHLNEPGPSMFKSKSDLKQHLRTHSDLKPFECEQCSAKFKTKRGLKQHLRRHSGLKPFECKHCSAKFKLKSHLKQHFRAHSDLKPFECEQCSAKFKFKQGLERHSRTHESFKPFECEQSSTKFNCMLSLKKHLIVHNNEKLFDCELCSAKFERKSQLRTHLRVHYPKPLKPLKPFKCCKCSAKSKSENQPKQQLWIRNIELFNRERRGIEFLEQPIFNEHLKKPSHVKPVDFKHLKKPDEVEKKCGKLGIHNEKLINQEHSGIEFLEQPIFHEHLKKPSSEQSVDFKHLKKPDEVEKKCGSVNKSMKHCLKGEFVCRHCESVFGTFSRVYNHLKVYTDGQLFKCNLCAARFYTCSELKLHLKKHFKRVLKSKLCSAKFQDKSELNNHLRVHRGGLFSESSRKSSVKVLLRRPCGSEEFTLVQREVSN